MVGSFVVCYGPYAATAMWFANAEDSNKDYRLVAIPAFFSKSSCVYNPLIYAFMNKQVRWTTQPCWIITVHMQTNTNALPFCIPVQCLHHGDCIWQEDWWGLRSFQQDRNLFCVCINYSTPHLQLFWNCFPFILLLLVQIPNIYTLSRAEGVPLSWRHSPLEGQTGGWYPTIFSVQNWYTFKYVYFILFYFVMKNIVISC